MTGLLVKDCLTLVKQMKIFLVIIIVFSIVPGYNMSAFAIVYSALLPMTALAYDERSKWDMLASMMPYRPRDMVTCIELSKKRSMINAVRHTAAEPGFIAGSAVMFCAGLITLSLLLPFMFRFGVEKGRIALFVIVGLAAVAAVFLSGKSEDAASFYASESISLSAVAGVIGAAAAVILIVSVLISVRIYSRKEF